MADMEFEHLEGGYAYTAAGRTTRMVNMAGAVCSVALIVGLGVWGYKLAVRDVNGIPVIRALAGPLRISPENPGGEVVMHQGLSVNAVAAAGTALPIPESLRLAPRPVELTDEDAAGLIDPETDGALPADPAALPDVMASEAADMAPEAVQTADMAPIETEDDSMASAALPAPVPEGSQDAVAMALAEALGQAPVEAEDGPAAEPVDVALLPEGQSPAASPRPRLRPGAGEVSAVETVAAVAPVEVDAATITAGTRLVQLGAFDDADAARGEWARLGQRFGDLMAGKSMVVQAAQSGGRTFYRLRAMGFGADDESRRFCTALLAENATCIPVTQR